MKRAFLTAEWRHLLMVNYAIEPGVLEPFVPFGTELDRFEGVVYVSIVGFLFLNTRVRGLGVPFHRDFEEVNLRFYVRHKAPDGWRRGVVFIKEIVPRRAIAGVARAVYGENYVALPMNHSVEVVDGALRPGSTLRYGWRMGRNRYELSAAVRREPKPSEEGSQEQFITEHYWGYARRSGGETLEYEVQHPPWRVWQVRDAAFEGDGGPLYGEKFGTSLGQKPASAFVAEGSAVAVYPGTRFRAPGTGLNTVR